jgi:transposase
MDKEEDFSIDWSAVTEAAIRMGMPASTLPSYVDEELCQAAAAYIGDLYDEEFALLQPSFPPEPRQHHYTTNRRVLDALIWLHRSGRRQTQLPECYGSLDTIRKRNERWAVAGVYDGLLRVLPTLGLSDERASELSMIATQEGKRGERIRSFRAQVATSQPRGRA